MSRRWMKEFRRVNATRLEELHKLYSNDPSHDPERLRAAEMAIDVLEAPQVAAERALHERRMAELIALRARYERALADAQRLIEADLEDMSHE
jgi:hypothetical protein